MSGTGVRPLYASGAAIGRGVKRPHRSSVGPEQSPGGSSGEAKPADGKCFSEFEIRLEGGSPL